MFGTDVNNVISLCQSAARGTGLKMGCRERLPATGKRGTTVPMPVTAAFTEMKGIKAAALNKHRPNDSKGRRG
jgi:hypothetical protein